MTHTITIIGAGSAVFSLGMVRDLCLTASLQGSTVRFMDIDHGRLDAIHALCVRYAAEMGVTLTLEKTTDRRAALVGADVVVNAALVAGHHRLRAGWDVAQRHGYRWGGSLHVMHDEAFWINFPQLQLFESVIEDMLQICPQAWYIQVANPVKAGITHLTRKYPQAKIVGLCHGYGGVYYLADKLGLEREHITYEIPGVNHFIWLTKLFYRGQDAMPLLEQWIAEQGPTHWETCGYVKELDVNKLAAFNQRPGTYEAGNPFASKQAAFIFDGFWTYEALDQHAPDIDYGVAFWPTLTGTPEDRAKYMIGGWHYAIPAGSKNTDAAWKFIRYAFIDNSATMGVKTVNGTCVRSQFKPWEEGVRAKMGAENRLASYLSVFTDSGAAATKSFPVMPAQSFYQDELARVYDLVVRGEMTPQAGLDEVTKNVQAEVDKVA